PAGSLVQHRGIRLQRHALLQPVQEHRGDRGTLLRATGLLLDQRGEDDRLLRTEPDARRALGEVGREHLVKPPDHGLQDALWLRPERKRVGVRKEIAFRTAGWQTPPAPDNTIPAAP